MTWIPHAASFNISSAFLSWKSAPRKTVGAEAVKQVGRDHKEAGDWPRATERALAIGGSGHGPGYGWLLFLVGVFTPQLPRGGSG